MIQRDAEAELRKVAGMFKAIAVVGPRQSGKTTLVKYVFAEKTYVSLENPDTRSFALQDPRGFLAQFPKGAILDEAQRTPELFSYLQEILDNLSGTGHFIITGSNNFLLQESISQSLAGRVAYLYLLPFSHKELSGLENLEVFSYIFKGSYPPIYSQPVEAGEWYRNYISTYIERDVRQLKNISNLNLFERFVKLCAGRIGNLLNINSLAMEAGIDNKTALSWIGILESSFILFRLQPHYKSFNKRLVKMPKIYFYDTGLVCSLLGIQNSEQLVWHPYIGNLFENMMISEIVKYRFNRGQKPDIYFWRDNYGHEVDIVLEKGQELLPIEIKSGKTINPDMLKGLEYWLKLSDCKKGYLLYSGDESRLSNKIEIVPWDKQEKLYATF
ncbi:MAG: ATP-binding protein [Bacteroidetes bacterium]|nr:ATP-binding protein [Bacteroidota bacterium]